VLAREADSYRRRTILVNSCLSSIPLYMMISYRMPIGVRKRAYYLKTRMVRHGEEGIKKYHLISCGKICRLGDLQLGKYEQSISRKEDLETRKRTRTMAKSSYEGKMSKTIISTESSLSQATQCFGMAFQK
jgi:hypothetical protein